ncbi:tRNA-uridine aminocarboxypropyltransferase [Agaribacterium sp. ZY112]|uniref:tRNA-uridine aminocarboxypropyltransferase n=1 Tax=Agaribacterium sp. ZY112 TaxID=3233574 RepID=UPI003523E068
MKKRSYCEQCQLPMRTCVCSAVKPQHCLTQIEILQHPQESKAAKNTAFLLKLSFPQQVRLWLGEQAHDFAELREELRKEQLKPAQAQPWAVLYPSEVAEPISHIPSTAQGHRLIVIDATWRKAYKMWQLNQWLHQLPQYKLEGIKGRYARASSVKHALSTLECVQHTLTVCEPKLDTQALQTLFDLRQSHFKQAPK